MSRKKWTAGDTLNASDLNNAFTFGGDGSDGALAISTGTTTIDCANAAVVVKNYTSISITGTGKLAFINPNNNGTVVILKSQNDVTLTSSAAPMIDMSAMGGAGAPTNNHGAGSGDNSGSDGSNGYGALVASNYGHGGVGASAGGAGGALPNSFAFSGFNKSANKYPLFWVGAGGGAGGCTSSAVGASGPTGGAGGRGGGGLIIECGGAWNFTTASGISVAGASGGNGTTDDTTNRSGGGGGGGAGGFLLVLYNTLTANTGTVTTAGGTGGNKDSGGSRNAAGGGGGASGSNAGSNGTIASSTNAKTGGDGGSGISLITPNTEF